MLWSSTTKKMHVQRIKKTEISRCNLADECNDSGEPKKKQREKIGYDIVQFF